MNIFDIVTAANVQGYYEESTQSDTAPLGQALFPRTKQLGLKLSYIKGKGGLPVVLKPSAFDVRSTLRDRIGLETVETELPFFKEGMLIKERDRQDLLTMMQTGNQEYVNLVTQRIFNDDKELLDGAQAQEERLRMQLLTQGKIAISANGVNFEYDYGMPADNKLESTKPWSDPAADIGKDLIGWFFEARQKGHALTRAVTNSSTLMSIADNTKISNAILAGAGGAGIVTPQMVASYIQNTFGFSFIVYDAMFTDEAGSMQKYIPDGVISFIPAGTLGQTVFGTTPEEADLMSGGTDAQVAIVNTGMAIKTIKQTDPVNVETIVSMIVLPSFEAIDQVYIADITKGA